MLEQTKTQPGEQDLMVAKEPPTGVRLPTEIKQAIERLAKDDDRSLSYVITKLLREALRARKLIR